MLMSQSFVWFKNRVVAMFMIRINYYLTSFSRVCYGEYSKSYKVAELQSNKELREDKKIIHMTYFKDLKQRVQQLYSELLVFYRASYVE